MLTFALKSFEVLFITPIVMNEPGSNVKDIDIKNGGY